MRNIFFLYFLSLSMVACQNPELTQNPEAIEVSGYSNSVGNGQQVEVGNGQQQVEGICQAIQGQFEDLKIAILNNDTNAVKSLIEEGVNIDQTDSNPPALIWATFLGRAEIVELLLDAGANPDIQTPRGKTALMQASSDSPHNSPLSRAGIDTRVRIVQSLLNANAQVNIQDNNEQTALFKAVMSDYTIIADLLRQAGATE